MFDPAFPVDRVACEPTPEQEEGPYYRELDLVRSDIAEDRTGVPLRLGIRVVDDACAPVAGVIVDVWHCDAVGRYSWAETPEGEAEALGTAGLEPGTFLRGRQLTANDGVCEFRTIYPGWYHGRSVHVHYKVRHGDHVATGQLYFPDALTDEVHAHEPYARHPGRDTKNEDDTIVPEAQGRTMLAPAGGGSGFNAAITIAV